MSLSAFLAGVGFHQNVIDESNALVLAIQRAKQDFSYQIGNATSNKGGIPWESH